MTDEQWSTLTKWLKVPAAARAPIENELDLYRRAADAATSPPSETRKNLERAAEVADKLLGLIEGFGPDEHCALAERGESVALSHLSASLAAPEGVAPTRVAVVGGSAPRLDALKLMVEQHAQLSALRDRMATAAAKVGRGKTGGDASNTRALVKRVSEIVETYAGTPLNKGKRELDFAEELGKLADPPISANSIKGAIETLAQKKLSAENSANSG
jgi:hypothetical protein